MTSDTNNTAPDRIWDDPNGEDIEYIRADLHERLVAEAVAAALEEAINRVNGCDRVSEVQPAISALIEEKKA